MFRNIVLLAVVAVCAVQAGMTFNVPLNVIAHPVKSFRTKHDGTGVLLAGTVLLQSVNAIDYATTRRGAFPGTGGCELNPLLVTAPCQINVPRFTGVKIGVAAFNFAQWLPVWAGYRNSNYRKAMGVLDFVGAVPLGVADINNIHQLTK